MLGMHVQYDDAVGGQLTYSIPEETWLPSGLAQWATAVSEGIRRDENIRSRIKEVAMSEVSIAGEGNNAGTHHQEHLGTVGQNIDRRSRIGSTHD